MEKERIADLVSKAALKWLSNKDDEELSEDLNCICGLLFVHLQVIDHSKELLNDSSEIIWTGGAEITSRCIRFEKETSSDTYDVLISGCAIPPVNTEQDLDRIFHGNRFVVDDCDWILDGDDLPRYRLFQGARSLGITVIRERDSFVISYYDTEFKEVRTWNDVISYICLHSAHL